MLHARRFFRPGAGTPGKKSVIEEGRLYGYDSPAGNRPSEQDPRALPWRKRSLRPSIASMSNCHQRYVWLIGRKKQRAPAPAVFPFGGRGLTAGTFWAIGEEKNGFDCGPGQTPAQSMRAPGTMWGFDVVEILAARNQIELKPHALQGESGGRPHWQCARGACPAADVYEPQRRGRDATGELV